MNPFVYVLSVNGLLFLLSCIFWYFPPKKINNIYGYRTHRSMQNEDIWHFSNRFFNKNLLFYSGISFAGAIGFAYFFGDKVSWQPMVLVLLTILVSIIKTERALTETFDEKGKRK